MKNFTLRSFTMLLITMFIGFVAQAQPTDWLPADPGMSFTAAESKINVYPNPSAGNVNVALPQGTGNVMLTVLDVSGKVIYRQMADAADERVISSMDLSNKASGMLILKITNETRVLASKIFLVNRSSGSADGRSFLKP